VGVNVQNQIDSWKKIFQNLFQQSSQRKVVLIYPPSRLKIANHIDEASRELNYEIERIDVFNAIKPNENPSKFLSSIENLHSEDVVIIVRHKNFMKKLQFERFFSFSSGFQASDARVIVLHMLIEDTILTNLCDIDYLELGAYTDDLETRVKDAKKIRLSTYRGTDLTFMPRRWTKMPYNFNDKSKVLLLPVGQLYTAPIEIETNGTIVIDRCISEFPINFKDIISFPSIKEEIILNIRNGKIESVEGEEEASFLENICLPQVSEGGRILGEVTFGTNPTKSLLNNIGVQDVLRDTVHFGFGMNTHLGGLIKANTHWDAVISYNQNEIEILE